MAANHAGEDDGQLAQQAAAGDRENFRKLVERHQDPVFRFAFHLLRDPHAAEDAAQDVFIKAFRRLDSFDPLRGSFSSWLAGITRNTCLDAIERRKRDQPAAPSDQLPEFGTSDEAVERREVLSLLDHALEELAEPFRSTFILAEIEERPLQEIADLDRVALGTVKSRVSRAREKLRVHLEPLLSKS